MIRFPLSVRADPIGLDLVGLPAFNRPAMDLERSLLTSTQTWFTSGLFVATLVLMGLNVRPETLGTITVDPDKDTRRMVEMHLSEALYVEERVSKELDHLISAAQNPSLKQLLEQHRKESAAQRDRLTRTFESLGSKPLETRVAAIDGLIADNERMLSEFMNTTLQDEVIMAGLRKVKHYEIAMYQILLQLARYSDLKVALVVPLEESLNEEENMEEALGKFAEERTSSADDEVEIERSGGDIAPTQRRIRERN